MKKLMVTIISFLPPDYIFIVPAAFGNACKNDNDGSYFGYSLSTIKANKI